MAHGEELCRAFQAAGHDFRQSTYRDGIDETEAMVEGFRRGEFTGLVSVEKFVKGFDVPREVQKSPDAIQPVCERTPKMSIVSPMVGVRLSSWKPQTATT